MHAKASAAALQRPSSALYSELEDEASFLEDEGAVDAGIDAFQERFGAYADAQGLQLRWLEEERALAREEAADMTETLPKGRRLFGARRLPAAMRKLEASRRQRGK